MKIQSIRNATMKVEYHGRRFVCDPYLAEKFSRPSFSGKSANPLVDLPCPPQEVIHGAEFILLSHLHSDHFDPAAAELIAKNTLIMCQSGDTTDLEAMGFTNIIPIEDSVIWNDIYITRIAGQHGSSAVLDDMGQSSGFIFSAPGEPTLYWVGDTLLTDSIRHTITRTSPDVIITHSSGAIWGEDNVQIVMDAAQTVEICHLAPRSKIIAIHMEALDHGTVTRASLRELAVAQGISGDQLVIPQDGEFVILP